MRDTADGGDRELLRTLQSLAQHPEYGPVLRAVSQLRADILPDVLGIIQLLPTTESASTTPHLATPAIQGPVQHISLQAPTSTPAEDGKTPGTKKGHQKVQKEH